jgi:hypothetical protein
MSALDDRRRLEELYLPSADDFVLVDVPDLQFVMIDGEGDPGGEVFARAMRWLFAVIHPIKRIAMERMGKSFVEPSLEGLWWADDMNDLITGKREKLKWRLIIVTADWVDQRMFDQALAKTSKRLGEPPSSLRLERFAEGLSVQIMHVGPNSEEGNDPRPAAPRVPAGARPRPQRASPRDLPDGSEPRSAREAQDRAAPARLAGRLGASGSRGSPADRASSRRFWWEPAIPGVGQGAATMVVGVQSADAVPRFLTLYMACTPGTASTTHVAWDIDTFASGCGWGFSGQNVRLERVSPRGITHPEPGSRILPVTTFHW